MKCYFCLSFFQMNPVNDSLNDKPWHPLDLKLLTFAEGVSNDQFFKMWF